MKIETIHVDHLTWSKPEWAEPDSEALVAHAAGYELEIGPGKGKNEWDWACKRTRELSETPELVAMGTAKSVSGAKRGAGTAGNNDQRLRAKAKVKTEGMPEFPEPEPEPGPTGGEMLDDTEKAVEQAMAAQKAATPKKRTRKPAEQPETVAA